MTADQRKPLHLTKTMDIVKNRTSQVLIGVGLFVALLAALFCWLTAIRRLGEDHKLTTDEPPSAHPNPSTESAVELEGLQASISSIQRSKEQLRFVYRLEHIRRNEWVLRSNSSVFIVFFDAN